MWRLYFFFIKHKTVILDRLKHFLLIISLLCCLQNIFAQNSYSKNEWNEIDKNLNETIFITTNTNSYLTGETLLYKIFCIDKTTSMASKYSKVAYFDIVDSNKKIVCTQKLFLENGTGNGDFFIPTTLETGVYKIIGYTKWMLNKTSDTYFTANIYILNPYTVQPATNNTKDAISFSEPVTNNNISFEIKNKVFDIRVPVELKIKTLSDDYQKGNYMISVRKVDSYSADKKLLFNDYQITNANKPSKEIGNNSNLILPELRGEIISGRLKSDAGQIKNKKVALSLTGKNYDLKLAKTDEQGHFFFNLERAETNPNIIIQVLEEGKENYSIEVEKTNKIDYSNLTFPNLKFHSESNKYITERLISSQVENAYYNVKKDSVITSDKFVPFFGNNTKEFKFDDYTRFRTMEETITEIITGVFFKKENNKYSLEVYDFNKDLNSKQSPLVVVDGFILEDLNEFFTYNPKNLYKVNVINGIYFYGSKSFNGLVCFTTKNGDYESKLKGSFLLKPELLRPVSKKQYFQPDYSSTKNTRIPDYRHQLLWLPKADLSDKNTAIKFYTSDVSGRFEIILEGFSAKGAPVYIKDVIEVKNSTFN